MKYHSFVIFVLFVFLISESSYADHAVEYRFPASIVTTVGELTTIQIDIKNIFTSQLGYYIEINANSPNEIEITNPRIITPVLNPGQSTSVFTNIRTLTDSPNVLTVSIYTSYYLPLHTETISVQSKKYSLPEFGLTGFLQIITIASLLYFANRMK